MDSMEALMEFFRGFFGVLAGGKLKLIPVIIILCLGLVLSAAVIVIAVLTAKAANRRPKLAVTAGVFATLTILTAPFYNNLFKGFINGYMDYLDVLIRFMNTPSASPDVLTDKMASFMSSIFGVMPFISVLSAIVLVSMILTLVFIGKCFKSKYKVFPIFAFILVFVRYFYVSPVAISIGGPGSLINNVFSIAQVLFYCFMVALPYLLLIPFAILNLVHNKKNAQ